MNIGLYNNDDLIYFVRFGGAELVEKIIWKQRTTSFDVYELNSVSNWE